ncbi:Hypothetical_protein [Hexamita inflata]|uniref:Hypothetical_protein n=1 Tax=Hexamita inflata TaxID=28002 RepID=A0AA86PL22_9EUKA|nr:Hypothetical protein HINF_LOCUS29359 [Hexamita inflata]
MRQFIKEIKNIVFNNKFNKYKNDMVENSLCINYDPINSFSFTKKLGIHRLTLEQCDQIRFVNIPTSKCLSALHIKYTNIQDIPIKNLSHLLELEDLSCGS